ncbi:MAG TPA: hypothetical protein VEK08_03530 [Planctomycetota bacterium]|nr:hypothetical protein [Planctomycetota bacterium]
MNRLCLLSVVLFFAAVPLLAGEGGGAQHSELLIKTYRKIMMEVFELMKTDRRLPPTSTESDINARIDATVENLKKTDFFKVTAEQQKKFEAGEFNDAENNERLQEMIKFLQGTKIEMPAPTVYSIQEFQAGRLKGAELEVCRRLVALNVEKLKSILGGKR